MYVFKEIYYLKAFYTKLELTFGQHQSLICAYSIRAVYYLLIH